jgi:DNA processing protein
VLDDLGGIAPLTGPAPLRLFDAAAPPTPRVAPPLPLDPLQQAIWDALTEPRDVDGLSRQVETPMSELTGVLMTLELKRVIRRLPGNCYERT